MNPYSMNNHFAERLQWLVKINNMTIMKPGGTMFSHLPRDFWVCLVFFCFSDALFGLTHPFSPNLPKS